MAKMTEGGTMEIYHIVEEGETLNTLAQTFGADPVNIFNEDNSEVAEEVLPGDTVCIHEEVEPVSVRMVEEGRMKETIEYETVKKESDDYYKGDTYTSQEGVDGVQIFDGTITKVAGEVTKRDGDTEVIREKQDKIILVGTAERPKTAPTGTFAMPIQRYTLSYNFGYRWGRLHSGIDMAAPTGTPIYASDGGTVVRAGWYGGYGLCVDIQHDDGKQTRYGHCSRLLVNAGDKVYQGQNIALVGNTGHSFGSHMHFEIHLNGSPVNPRPILGI
jgi:murein DD-endopeptidase MepM/ murein hydrolase activator NlpD